MTIRLTDISKIYPGNTVAVAHLSLDIPAGELVALVGPSGCGKSTTLRMINRLIEPTSGQIWLGTENVTTADPVQLRRRIGYVIQHVGLFPHQSVARNVATVPNLLRWKPQQQKARVAELLELVGLDPNTFSSRYPHELSGGQRQRVGVARALAANPSVLLMDEPFSAIDPIARTRLQREFLALQRELRKTVVMVTHDIDEAIILADRIAVLSEQGKLEQYASPEELLAAPANEFVAGFIGGDRSLRRLAVTPLDLTHLVPFSAVNAPPPAGIKGEVPSVLSSVMLKEALAELLSADQPWIAVRSAPDTMSGGETRWLGALTLPAVREMLRAYDPKPPTAE